MAWETLPDPSPPGTVSTTLSLVLSAVITRVSLHPLVMLSSFLSQGFCTCQALFLGGPSSFLHLVNLLHPFQLTCYFFPISQDYCFDQTGYRIHNSSGRRSHRLQFAQQQSTWWPCSQPPPLVPWYPWFAPCFSFTAIWTCINIYLLNVRLLH